MKKMKVQRGTARAIRRARMDKFRAAQRERANRETGTIRVNAPSLQMLGQFIGRVGER